MEGTPLGLAYTHVRNAAQETQRSNSVAASEEHDLAAAEFAVVAESTDDPEAKRILILLEQHHKQLGHILKTTYTKTDAVKEQSPAHLSPLVQDKRSASTKPGKLSHVNSAQHRDYSGSIIEVLASARGIPPGQKRTPKPVDPLITDSHADGSFAQDAGAKKNWSRRESQVPRLVSRPSWAPPLSIEQERVHQKAQAAADAAAQDAPFQQFYNTFGGLINKLSAPLAFAALPLSPVAAVAASGQSRQKSAPRKLSIPNLKTSPTSSVDYTANISRAAIDATSFKQPVDNRGFRPHESFMMIPPSYANVAALTHSAHHRKTSVTSNDDFVDAKSQIFDPAAKIVRAGDTSTYDGKTIEELALENRTFRKSLQEISKRLQAFEMSAQATSHILAQSVRNLASPALTPSNSRGGHVQLGTVDSNKLTDQLKEKMMKQRIVELEDVLKKYDRKLAKRDEENAKLKDVVGKYRDKWEGLKAGAKARRDLKTDGSERPSTSRTTSSAAAKVSGSPSTGELRTG